MITGTEWISKVDYERVDPWKNELKLFGDALQNTRGRVTRSASKAKCVLPLLSECVMSVTNPVPDFEELESGLITGLYAPRIRQLELEMVGHTLYVLGINSGPRYA